MKILVIVNGQRNSILIHFSNFIIITRSVGLFLDTQVSKCIYVFKRKQKERISRDLSELVNYLYMISYLHICIISYILRYVYCEYVNVVPVFMCTQDLSNCCTFIYVYELFGICNLY